MVPVRAQSKSPVLTDKVVLMLPQLRLRYQSRLSGGPTPRSFGLRIGYRAQKHGNVPGRRPGWFETSRAWPLAGPEVISKSPGGRLRAGHVLPSTGVTLAARP